MKTKLILILFSSFILLPCALPQGSPTPPGTPAQKKKTHAQIEPRTPISSAPVTIGAGSYYLTNNITVASGNAITIAPSGADGVTLDLNGFTISSTAASATGIGIRLGGVIFGSANANITILNGHIRGRVTNNGGTYSGSGFAYGIFYSTPIPQNVRVAGVSVSNCLTAGINLGTGNSTVVESCTVKTIGGIGIMASSVSRSTAYECGLEAIVAYTASDCYGSNAGGNAGLRVNTANNCYGESGSFAGVVATVANNCYAVTTGSGGAMLIDGVANNCYAVGGMYGFNATNCYGTRNGIHVQQMANNCWGVSDFASSGLSARIANNCYGESHSGTGLEADVAINCYGLGGSSTGTGLHFTTMGAMCYGSRPGTGGADSAYVLGGGANGPRNLP
jgi:hypothetical protein